MKRRRKGELERLERRVDKEILQFCVARRSEAPLARTPRTAVKEQRTKIKEQRTSEGVKEMRGREEAGEGGVEG